jgi:hypothetical protein
VYNPQFTTDTANCATPDDRRLCPLIINDNKMPYTETAMYGNSLFENSDYVALINEARGTCDAFGPNIVAYPIGIPFRYWQQYVDLKDLILRTVGYALAAAFGCTTIMLYTISARAKSASVAYRIFVSAWGGLLITFTILVIVTESAGLLGWFEIQISAIPTVSLIMCAGVGVEFTAHLVLAYMIATGTRSERMQTSLDVMFIPTFDGFISTFLGVLILGFTEFEFIFRYFFLLYLIIVLLCVLNGLLFLPVLLCLVGPPSFYPEGDAAVKDSTIEIEDGSAAKHVDML